MTKPQMLAQWFNPLLGHVERAAPMSRADCARVIRGNRKLQQLGKGIVVMRDGSDTVIGNLCTTALTLTIYRA